MGCENMVELGDVVRIIMSQDNQEYLVVRKKESGKYTLAPISIAGFELEETKMNHFMKSQLTDGTNIFINYLDFSNIHIDKLVLTEHSMKNKRFYWDVSEAYRIHMRDIQRAKAQHKAEVQRKKEQQIRKIRSDPQKVAKLTAAYEIAEMNNDKKQMERIKTLLGNAPMKRGKYSKASRLSGSGYFRSVSGGKCSHK